LSYATTAELVLLTGSSLATATLQALLDEADRQIKVKLAIADITPPGSDDKLKSACLSLDKAELLGRVRVDGSHTGPPEYDWSGTEMTSTITQLKEAAHEAIYSYILAAGASDRYRWSIRKVNA